MEKILHILYSGLGGTTDYVFNLINGDKNSDFEHHILFYGIETVPKEQLVLAEKTATSVVYIQKQQGYDKKAFQNVLSNIKNIKPDSITLHVNSLILTCAKYKQAKLIFVEHQANHLKSKKEWLWSIIAQTKANHIVCLTETYQTTLKSRLKFLYISKKNNVITTGINVSEFQKKANNTSTLNIGILSRLNKFRDHKTLIAAFNELQLNTTKLNIDGDGPLLNQLQDSNQNKNIQFLGNIQQNKIPIFLSKQDIYCQASFGETSSIALMQAQASGLPIIAANVNGINNVLNSENCIFVKPGNVESYKSALLQLVNDKTKRIALSKESIEFANKNLSHYQMFEKYKIVLES